MRKWKYGTCLASAFKRGSDDPVEIEDIEPHRNLIAALTSANSLEFHQVAVQYLEPVAAFEVKLASGRRITYGTEIEAYSAALSLANLSTTTIYKVSPLTLPAIIEII